MQSSPAAELGIVQASRDGTACKCALCLLRRALPPAALRQPPWSTFLSLFELLEEIPLYLIEAHPSRPRSLILHMPAMPSFAVAAPSPANIRRFRALPLQCAWTAQIGRLSQPDGEECLEPEWVLLLWRRGLAHGNPQVSRGSPCIDDAW